MIWIILFSALVFFWNSSQWFVFTMDQEYISFLAKSLTENFHWQWLGVSAADFNIYLGPGFNYFTFVWFKLSNNDPLVLAIVAGVIGVLTVWATYLLARRLYNNQIATLSSFILTTLSGYIYFQRIYWNPVLVPIISVLFFYTLTYRTKHWWPFVYWVLLGVSFHIHFSLVLFFLPLLYYLWKDKLYRQRYFYFGILAFLMINLPQIGYEFISKFSNIKNLISIFIGFKTTQNQFNIAFLANKITLLGQSVIFTETKLNLLIGLIIIVYLIINSYKLLKSKIHKKLEPKEVLYIFTLIFVLSFVFLPHKAPLYYLLAVYPLLAIIFATELNRLFRKKVLVLIFILLIWTGLNFVWLLSYQGKNLKRTYPKKMIIVKYIKNRVGNKAYNLEVDNYQNFTGVRYLLEHYYFPPVSSNIDNVFGWIYNQYLPENNSKNAQTIRLTEDLFGN